ncbi:hydroxyphenylacetyl-CoA thioesterase PaaI [Leucobacter luti]|uniref:Acyl-CoA thioesterase n=1 Tax=Leucobacter luti TaxID=340320 RepID=A0A4Q7U7Q6_9MICO|nr:hydroxyphenylacetyl-CoA thioesterase PaaI [Leucobacter luti]MBL3700697.1 hydroxyphenylacetyl-CoA thioesterase PaaI [Leucobacter luti]RZT68462.1 acyl-CoA thioesterase [Leucobacter luti]
MSSVTNPQHIDLTESSVELDPTWSATAMLRTDTAKRAFGIRIAELERGRAVLSMEVRDDMVNGFGITHGGMVFTLADTAFAYACNEGANAVVASGVDITFTRASGVGDTLFATAERRWLRGRNGLYDITVTDQTGEVVAEFRGRSFATDRPLPQPA